MTETPTASSVEHWNLQVDTPFRGPSEIRELAGRARPEATEAGWAEDEDVFGEDLVGEAEFEEYGALEQGAESESYDAAELGGADLSEEASANEHPLASVFALPRLAFDAMARGAWGTAIAVAVGAGRRDVNQLTNMVFWFRHPQLIGQKLRADQTDLIREWLQIRDQIVWPALAGAVMPSTSATGAGVPSPTGAGTRTSIPPERLRWFGTPGEETPELLSFMRSVYDLHVKRSRGDFVDTLPESAIEEVEAGKYARKDAAAKAREMLAAARSALATAGLTGTVRIGVLSGYRSADLQFDIWQGKRTNGKGGFPQYYEETKAARTNPKFGGEHSDKAAAYLAEYLGKCVAAPGYSNHQDGLALDLGTRKGKGGLIKLYKGSWFHTWLTENARMYGFEPLATEAWHWVYRAHPGATASEAWESEVTPTAVPAGRLEVPTIPLLRSHRGQAPDLILRWNDMPTVPTEIDVVVHLHGYSWAAMTLPKHMEVWSGLDLAPVDGASGTGRTRPTLTVLPRGHFTCVQVGRIYRYTFPALTTKDGLATLLREAVQRFSARVGGVPPKVGRLILTAHSGGGAPLLQILRRCDPQEVHVFDGLYQDATPLAEWASRHIKADRAAVRGGAAPNGAMRVFFGTSTRGHSARLARALAADLHDAPADVANRYRVESSRLGHWQIARQYGWRMLTDPGADVPDAARARTSASVTQSEIDTAEVPFLPTVGALPEADESETDLEEPDEWELGELETEGDAETPLADEEGEALRFAPTPSEPRPEPAVEVTEAEARLGSDQPAAEKTTLAETAVPADLESGSSAPLAWAEAPTPPGFLPGESAIHMGGEADHSAGGLEELGETEAIDQRRTTSWAIASLGGGGIIFGYSLFLLVNRETGREHGLHIPTGGLTTQFGVAGASPPSYTMFETSRPVSFADFHGIGARLTSANIGIFLGYSIVYLTLWDGPAYASQRLAYVKMGGWGAMIPGGSVAHGVTAISYGSGRRSGVVPLVLAPEADDSVREPAMVSIRLAAMESPRIALPSDALFDFDSAEIKPAAQSALLYVADLLNNRRQLAVEIEGHTDSTGSSPYNLGLSARRAEAVKRWLISHRVHGANDFRVVPYGESRPVTTNTTPEGRRRNRRVVINAGWGL